MPRVAGTTPSPTGAGDPRVFGNAGRGRIVASLAMARPQLVPSRTDWFDEAACRDVDTDIFFPPAEADAAAAKEICARCPVREECLEFALEASPAPEGVWGGLTRVERHRLVRRRQKAARKARGAAA
jgi:WhiB family redox-sensing transcriptional regulator